MQAGLEHGLDALINIVEKTPYSIIYVFNITGACLSTAKTTYENTSSIIDGIASIGASLVPEEKNPIEMDTMDWVIIEK